MPLNVAHLPGEVIAAADINDIAIVVNQLRIDADALFADFAGLAPADIGAASAADVAAAVANLQLKVVTVIFESGGTYAVRPLNYAMVLWVGHDAPTISSTYALVDVDKWIQTP